jgi:pre-mRNA-splicing factor RBM22/SLT11
MKDRFGRECRVCARPYSVFKWRPGQGQRPKMTEICQTCGKLKNCCQSCLKDLEYNMDMATRDKLLGDDKVEIPGFEANRDYWAEQANRHIGRLILPYDKPIPILDQILKEPRLPVGMEVLQAIKEAGE